MLTKTEAVDFLQNIWNVKNVLERLSTDRKKFLDELIVVIHGKVPFQTLTIRKLALISCDERPAMTLDDIDRECMSGNGGNCATNNLFTRSLLNALGYSAHVCPTSVTGTRYNPHLIVLVKDLQKKGDLHLVDCGLGLPAFRVIPLDFDQESPVYRDSFLEYKFIRHDGRILRMHGRGDLVKHTDDQRVEDFDFYVGKWRRFYHFAAEPVECQSLQDLDPLFTMTYLPRNLPLRAVWFPARRTVMVIEEKLMIEKEDGTFDKATLRTDEEILKCYRDHFPTMNKDTVIRAYALERTSSKL